MRSRGLVVAGGQDHLAGVILRIGHLGDVSVDDVVAAIEVIGQSAAELGMAIDPAQAAAAARSAGRAGDGVHLRTALTCRP